MTSRMTWPDLCRSERYKGLWVAIDNCRYDASTRQPVEGDVVDSDEELSELCARMREAGRSSCEAGAQTRSAGPARPAGAGPFAWGSHSARLRRAAHPARRRPSIRTIPSTAGR